MPCVPGHESAGVIEAVGPDVTYVQPGDHVITCMSAFCGVCRNCTAGRPALCESTETWRSPGNLPASHKTASRSRSSTTSLPTPKRCSCTNAPA